MCAIITCYILIGFITANSKTSAASSNESKIRDRKLQRKVSITIITDFIYWVPCIVTCLLHFSGTIDAPEYYTLFSIVVLPINSSINPLIYGSRIGEMVGFCRRGISRFGPSVKSSFIGSLVLVS